MPNVTIKIRNTRVEMTDNDGQFTVSIIIADFLAALEALWPLDGSVIAKRILTVFRYHFLFFEGIYVRKRVCTLSDTLIAP